MDFFRSAALRRVIYAVAIALALVRFATRSHSETIFPEDPPPGGIVVDVTR